MKSEKLTIRITSKEREKLEEEAKAVNHNISEHIRYLIFDKRVNDYDLIMKQLSSLKDGQKHLVTTLKSRIRK